MSALWHDLLFRVFLWCGSRLFNSVAIYSPDEENVEAVHFGISEQAVAKSCQEFAENSIR